MLGTVASRLRLDRTLKDGIQCRRARETSSLYETQHGTVPFEEWLEKLADLRGSAAIDGRIALLRRGSLGKKVREIGDGLIELKVETGPGYRIYIADDGRDALILCAG